VKDANRSTQIDTENAEPKKEAPSPPPQAKGQRARPGSSAHQDNQRSLGVGSDHKTGEMRRDTRGTFP
jgi:hypothetical protein